MLIVHRGQPGPGLQLSDEQIQSLESLLPGGVVLGGGEVRDAGQPAVERYLRVEVVRIQDADPKSKSPALFTLDLGPEKGKKQIFFKKPEVKPLNAIKTELESFHSAIVNNTIPPVTINDGYHALEVAHQIIEKISQSAANV